MDVGGIHGKGKGKGSGAGDLCHFCAKAGHRSQDLWYKIRRMAKASPIRAHVKPKTEDQGKRERKSSRTRRRLELAIIAARLASTPGVGRSWEGL
eukprot:3221985-Amphidinium_carterae.2